MSADRPQWGAGIVNHGSHDDLERCLASLSRETHSPTRIVVYDTGIDPDRFERIREAWPSVDFLSGPNVGYAGGANRVVDRLCTPPRSGDPIPIYLLIMNPDVELDADFAEVLIASMSHAPSVAIATGKLLRPDRQTLDSAGISFPRHRRPRDRGSDEPDRGQFDELERVEGASGAAMLIRSDAIETLSIEGELFDESFFAYHEDTDLCWRARRFGYEILYEPRAVGVHARGWQREARRRVPVEIRRHSFKNHYLQLVKNETTRDALRNLPWLLGWEVLRLGFVLLRDRPMLTAYVQAWRALPEARRRRRLIAARAAALLR